MNELATTNRSTAEKAAELAAEVVRSSRRGLLCGAFGVSAAAVLAACGSETTPPVSDPATQNPPAPGGSGTPGGGAALAKVADIPVGGGIVAGRLVLVQPVKDQVLAFDRACPHKGTQLPEPKDGTITCPSHGSQFKAADGSLAKGPAAKGLTSVPVTVKDGEVFAA